MTDDTQRFDRRAFLAAAVGTGVLLAGCSGEEDDTTTSPEATTVGTIENAGKTSTPPSTTGRSRTTTGSEATRTSADTRTTSTTDATTGAQTTAETPTKTQTTDARTTTESRTTTETRTTATTNAQPTTTATVTGGKRRKPQFSFAADHPVADGLGRQPYLGNPPGRTGKVVVMYQDVSSPVCRAFEFGAFQGLRSRHVVSGEVTFVVRDYPHVDDWSSPAVHGLESTYDRNADAYWPLRHYVYKDQSSFTMDNVEEWFASELRANTGVDPDAVVEDMAQGAYSPAIRGDLRNRKRANVTATPTFFLFDGTTMVERLEGNVEYEAFSPLF